jgi:Asp-tRNA(Asn)/Glu-tRNA(Gln) amidotransferase C subunit
VEAKPKAFASRTEVQLLAALAGIGLPEQDVAALVTALQGHLDLVEALDHVDVSAYEPDLHFDVRWR